MAAPAGTGGQNAFDRLDSSLARRALGAKNLSARQEAWVRLNQMRNHQAMAALLVALPPPAALRGSSMPPPATTWLPSSCVP